MNMMKHNTNKYNEDFSHLKASMYLMSNAASNLCDGDNYLKIYFR